MLYRDAVSVRAVHHVHVHQDIQEHAQKTITAHAIERAVYHVCTPVDWIRRRVGTVLPVVTVGWTATTNRTIRFLRFLEPNTMVARVRPIQNVHFITTVPPHVHLAIPMAERYLMDANTVMAKRAIKRVPGPVRKPAAPVDIPVRITHHRHRGNNITTVQLAMLLHQIAR